MKIWNYTLSNAVRGATLSFVPPQMNRKNRKFCRQFMLNV